MSLTLGPAKKGTLTMFDRIAVRGPRLRGWRPRPTDGLASRATDGRHNKCVLEGQRS